MKIVQIHASDGGGGGAVIAYHLMDELNKAGISSCLYVGESKTADDSRVRYLLHSARLADKVATLFHLSKVNKIRLRYIITAIARPKFIAKTLFGKEYSHVFGTKRELKHILEREKPDIVHLHNLHSNFFDLSALVWLSHQVPTIITLHDAWLLTGHCAHFFSCMKWKFGCGQCPNLSVYPRLLKDATAYNWAKRLTTYSKSQLFVVGPSKWIVDNANGSILKNGILQSKIIPNGVNLSVFYPGDKIKARNNLSLPLKRFIVVFSASGLKKNDFKDYMTLRNALEILGHGEENLLCLAIGDTGSIERIGAGIELRFIPFISDASIIAEYYRAADVYVHPAKADTFPTSIIEAEACGLPVVGTAVCGIPEQIENGVTGFTVPLGDAGALAQGILRLKHDLSLRENMGRKAAQRAKEKYNECLMISQYMDTYKNMLSIWESKKR